MRVSSIIIITGLLVIASLIGCQRPVVEQDTEETSLFDRPLGGVHQWIEQSLIPGECLQGTDLIYDDSYFRDWLTIGGLNDMWWINPAILPSDIDYKSKVLSFFLEMSLSVAKDSLQPYIYRSIPSNEVFEKFGSNAKSLASNYNDVYYSINFGNEGFTHQYTTILYRHGTLSLTANIPFAGIPAGEELGALVYVGNFLPDESLPVPGIEYTDDLVALDSRFQLYIPVEDHQIVVAHPTFTLKMPVKVGLFLQWLNDKLTNPEATMQYRDEVLTCTFTIHKGLH